MILVCLFRFYSESVMILGSVSGLSHARPAQEVGGVVVVVIEVVVVVVVVVVAVVTDENP